MDMAEEIKQILISDDPLSKWTELSDTYQIEIVRHLYAGKEKLALAIYALRIIALSYRERIDRNDTEPYGFAQDILERMGEDLERIPEEGILNAGRR